MLAMISVCSIGTEAVEWPLIQELLASGVTLRNPVERLCSATPADKRKLGTSAQPGVGSS